AEGLDRRGGGGPQEPEAPAARTAGREPVPRHLRRRPHQDDRGRRPQDAPRGGHQGVRTDVPEGIEVLVHPNFGEGTPSWPSTRMCGPTGGASAAGWVVTSTP